MKLSAKIALAAASLAVAASAAYAARNVAENDAAVIANAKISITQAISVAEQHVGGKAARADYENTRQGRVYDVEVVNGTKVFDVRVDAEKATVLSSVEDQGDRDDEHDERD